MKKINLALVAIIGILLSSCGSKTDVDFSIVPVMGSNGEYQYIDISKKGKIVINPQFSEAYIFRDGLALVKTSGRDGKYGYINKKGKYVIAPTYDYAQDFGEGVAWVQIEDQPPMLINKKGKMILQIDSITYAYPFANGMTTAGFYSQGEEFGKFINKEGEEIVETGEIGGKFSTIINDGLYAYRSKNSEKWGYKNKNGEIIINEQFDLARPFFEGVAVIKSGEKYGAIGKKGDFIINPQYDALTYDSDGLFLAKIGKKLGWINKKGEVIINPQYDALWEFYGNRLAPVKTGNKWAYVDKKGQIIINPQFSSALPFSGDYAMVMNSDGKIGFINQKGDFVVHPLYDGSKDDIKEYLYAIGQKKFNLPIWYYFEYSDEAFLPYDKLKEKRTAWAEIQTEIAKKKAEEEKAAAEARKKELEKQLDEDPSIAMNELEKAAREWDKLQRDYLKKNQGTAGNGFKAIGYTPPESMFFIYTGNYATFNAKTKVKIGPCPAGSTFELNWECYYDYCDITYTPAIPKACRPVIPKFISNFGNRPLN